MEDDIKLRLEILKGINTLLINKDIVKYTNNFMFKNKTHFNKMIWEIDLELTKIKTKLYEFGLSKDDPLMR